MEVKFDPSKISDFEFAMISAEINCCYHRIEQLNEILNKVGEAKGFADTGKTTQSTTNEPKQTSDFDNLPWKSYKTKQTADPDEAAWIFSNTQGAENLLSTIKSQSNGKTKIANFEYQLQGAEQQFIARKPIK